MVAEHPPIVRAAWTFADTCTTRRVFGYGRGMKILLTTPVLSFAFLVTVGVVTACGSSSGGGGGAGGSTSATTGSTSTSSATTTSGTGGAATSTTTSGSGGASGTGGSAAVTYTADAQPIYAAKCAPCHTTEDKGGVDFASTYADTQQAANPTVAPDCTAADNVGKCTLIRIKDGEMPFGAGCTGNPTTDAANAACLTAAEQATLQAWISGGEQQ
jgi:hypothetical protein